MKTNIYIWKCLLVFYLGSILLISCNSGYQHSPSERSLNVPYIAQNQAYWCWAACSQMVMEYNDPSGRTAHEYLQCKQAGMSMPKFCCSQPTNYNCCPQGGIWLPGTSINPECNHTNWPIFDECRFNCKDTYTSYNYLSWEDMLQQIDSSRPLCLTYDWTGGGAHMVVMDGYSIVDGVLYDHILDPFRGFAEDYGIDYTYERIEFRRHSNVRQCFDHTLGRCYYDIKKMPN